MRLLFALVAGIALWACHEHKPRPVTDCGDGCSDAGELEDAGETSDAGDDAGSIDAGDE